MQYDEQVSHDEVGNIVFNQGALGTGLPTYSNNRITSWPGGYTYTTDADGNVVTRTPPSPGLPTNFFWSPDGLLDSVKTGSSRKRFDYNAFGLLVRLWEGTGSTPQRHFVWDQGHLLIEMNGALTERRGEYAYLPGTDRPIAWLTGATTITARRYLYQDVQGNVIGTVFDNGAVHRAQASSDPWSTRGPGFAGVWYQAGFLADSLRLGWQGLFWESALGGNALYYARARWYDPRTKRFLSPDPIGASAGLNPYLFSDNDPLNGADATGLQTDCWSFWDTTLGTGGGLTIVCEPTDPDRARGVARNPSARGGSTQSSPPVSVGYSVKVPAVSPRSRSVAEQACYVREFNANKQRTQHILDAGVSEALGLALSPLWTSAARTTSNLAIVRSFADNVLGNVVSNPIATSLGVAEQYGPWNPVVRLRGIVLTGAASAARVVARNTVYGALASFGVDFAALVYSAAGAEAACVHGGR
jgi:RHS repeat-associated protein